jgi:hypothetical protein
MFRGRAEDIRLAAAENAREQRHDREGRRGREGQPVRRAKGGRMAASGTGARGFNVQVCIERVHRTLPSIRAAMRYALPY